MNTGKYVFAQLLDFIHKYEFEKCVTRYKGNHRVRELNCWNQFVQLFFGQLTSHNSLRDICVCLKAHKSKLYHLGIKQNVNQSTLSRANEKRDWRIFADFGEYLIKLVRPLYSNRSIPNIDIDNDVSGSLVRTIGSGDATNAKFSGNDIVVSTSKGKTELRKESGSLIRII